MRVLPWLLSNVGVRALRMLLNVCFACVVMVRIYCVCVCFDSGVVNVFVCLQLLLFIGCVLVLHMLLLTCFPCVLSWFVFLVCVLVLLLLLLVVFVYVVIGRIYCRGSCVAHAAVRYVFVFCHGSYLLCVLVLLMLLLLLLFLFQCVMRWLLFSVGVHMLLMLLLVLCFSCGLS